MKKSMQSKLKVIILCFMAIFIIVSLPGCAPKVTVPVELSGFSLVNVWNLMEKAAGVQHGGEHLIALHLYAGADGTVSSMDYSFFGWDSKGTSKTYFVDMNPRGQIKWYSNVTKDVFYQTQALPVFTEIDKLGLSSIPLGTAGMEMNIEFQGGDVTYSAEHVKISELNDGTLQPLKQVDFRTETMWCTISVSSMFRDNNDSGSVTRASSTNANGHFTAQIWFSSGELAKAENVEYLN
jgi:hypothetical protein